MIELKYEQCLQLMQKNRDYCLEQEDVIWLQTKFEHWQACLNTTLFQLNKQKYVLIYLAPRVEQEVQTTWLHSPSKAWMLEGLAQSICRAGAAAFLADQLDGWAGDQMDEQVDGRAAGRAAWRADGRAAGRVDGWADDQVGSRRNNRRVNLACLPLPAIEGELASLMHKSGALKDGRLIYKYALFTFYPGTQTCSICSLQASCPKII